MDSLINQPVSMYQDTRCLQTRSHAGLLFSIPSRCTSTYLKGFAYLGMMEWNALPLDIRLIESAEHFKNYLRGMMSQMEFEKYA